MRRVDGSGGGGWAAFDAGVGTTDDRSSPDGTATTATNFTDSYGGPGIFGAFDLGKFSPNDPNALRAELSKSFAGVDEEGLRKMEEEARARRAALQQSLRMNRGDPYLAARNTVVAEKISGGSLGSIAVDQMEALQDPTDD